MKNKHFSTGLRLLVFLVVFLLAKLTMQAQLSRNSDEDDIVVDVNVYSGETGKGWRRQSPWTGLFDKESPLDMINRSTAANLLSADPDYQELQEKNPELAAKIWREATTPKYILEEEKQAEANRKIAETDLELRQAELTQKQAAMDKTFEDSKKRAEIDAEIPQARKAILNLDPNEDHFLKLFIKLQDTFPLAFQDEDFYTKVAEPMLSKHMMLQEHKLKLQRGEN